MGRRRPAGRCATCRSGRTGSGNPTTCTRSRAPSTCWPSGTAPSAWAPDCCSTCRRDRRGRLDEAATARLLEVTAELRRRFATPLAARLTHEPGRVVAEFDTEVGLDHVELREELTTGQWAGAHEVRCGKGVVAAGHTVGVRRWHAFPAIRTRRLTVTLDDPRARLAAVTGFRTGHESPPAPQEQPALDVSKVD